MSHIEAPFEMANLFPKHTGVPFFVWISYRGGERHDVRVKVSRNAKAIPADMISVAIRPDVHIVEGTMDSGEFGQLQRWIERNRQTLIAYWEGEIDAQDALEALVKL
ncbi:MAG TPA: hypothetical protein VN780_12095 [Candidatus Eisenbacteria bacterium]|jgi:hypothetical protein|nr:hypothetical protein [Candidatus Eisenbacteria bacterium]